MEASGADWKGPQSKESNIRIWNSGRALRDKFGHHPRRSAGCKEKTITEILLPGTGEEEMRKRKLGTSSQVCQINSNRRCHEIQRGKEQEGLARGAGICQIKTKEDRLGRLDSVTCAVSGDLGKSVLCEIMANNGGSEVHGDCVWLFSKFPSEGKTDDMLVRDWS